MRFAIANVSTRRWRRSAALPGAAFDKLLYIVSNLDGSFAEVIDKRIEYGVGTVRAWAEGHDFPRGVAPPERDAFLASLVGLDAYTPYIKKELAQLALQWVAACQDLETAVAIGTALQEA